ncbi:MAG: CPBP family intramembrane glutamic endopeptidase [Gemmatimonadales bacterium]
MPQLVDHLLVGFLLLVVPVHGHFSYRRLAARLAAGEAGVRLAEYRWTIALEWAVVLVLLILWRFTGRSAESLGLTLPATWWSGLGLAITIAMLGLLLYQWRAIKRLEGPALDPLRAQLAGATALLPANEPEARMFRWVAVTAGICEEIVYRGYLIWYFGGFFGPWLGAVVGAVLFGLGHFYQGGSGVVKTGALGLFAGVLFVGTGSLLWPIILHAAIDLQGGAVAWRVLGPQGGGSRG